MKKLLLVIFLIIVIILLFRYGVFEKIACAINGGVWRDLSTTAVDSCGDKYMRGGQMITEGCDCGPEKCWTGFRCKQNPIEE